MERFCYLNFFLCCLDLRFGGSFIAMQGIIVGSFGLLVCAFGLALWERLLIKLKNHENEEKAEFWKKISDLGEFE